MKQSIWGKIGWGTVALLTAILSLVMQIGVGVVYMIVLQFQIAFENVDAGLTPEILAQMAADKYMANAIAVVAAYHVLGILVFGIWYYFAYGKKKRPDTIEKPGVKAIVTIGFLGIFLQVLITGVLGILMETFPAAFESYMEMMETSGITETTFLAVFATVVLAPIGEEILCRGLCLRLASKVSNKFWIANCIQAVGFGIIHASLVQGTYAFFLGLVLGYIYHKYENIWICMYLHAVINLFSNFMDAFFETLCGKALGPVALIAFIAAALIVGCFVLLEKKPKENANNA